MKRLKQPEKSNLCGQTCIAMVAKVPLDEAIGVVNKGGKTYNKDLIKGLKKLGIECADKTKRGLPECELAILKVEFHRTMKHWVVWKKGKIICPGDGQLHTVDSYLIKYPTVRPVSYIEIKNEQ